MSAAAGGSRRPDEAAAFVGDATGPTAQAAKRRSPKPRGPCIAYLVPDLHDAAAARRVAMFRAGGAEVRLSGFHRGGALRAVEGCQPTSLGQTRDAQLMQRAVSVARLMIRPGRLAALLRESDVVVARNLEMLALAWMALLVRRSRTRLVYEALDIHRLLSGAGLIERALRRLEGGLLRRVDQVIVSAPAFRTHHFERFHPGLSPVAVVENKVLSLSGGVRRCAPPPSGPPWRIGWFGMIRCRASLLALSRLAAIGAVEVIIRGRPSAAEFGDLAAEVARTPGLSFLGPYGREDLGTIHQEVHFVWGVDFFEDGLNSAWLLPNRLYEGGFHDRPVIALAQVETGRWLAERRSGVLLADVHADLQRFFGALTPATYNQLLERTRSIPRPDLMADRSACRALVDIVTGRT